MLTLALETTGMTGGVALLRDDELLGEVVTGSKSTYSRRLIKAVMYLLDELELSWKEIDLVAVSIGPGSFTGLRIGLATAKGLCLSTSAKLLGVPTLDILAQNACLNLKERLICPLIDARRKQVYTCLYETEGFFVKRISEYVVCRPEEIKGFVPEKKEVIFLGNGLLSYGDKLRELFEKRATFAPNNLWYPKPSNCGLLAKKMILDGTPPHDPDRLVPLYLRLSEAEEKRRMQSNEAPF